MMLSRREFSIAATASLILPSCASGKSLRILTWEGYIDDTQRKAFEEATGVKCQISYGGSVDEMFAKMRASGGQDFDVITLDSSSFPRYISQGLIQAVEVKQLPNESSLLPSFGELPTLKAQGKRWGVPFAWGSLPLIYDGRAFKTPPASWNELWSAQHSQKILMMDDANNCVTLAAILLGIADPFNLSDAEFGMVKEKLANQKKHVLTYYAGFDEGVSIFSQNGAELMFSMGEPQLKSLRAKGVDAQLTLPKEGAIGWVDCWAISAGARDLGLAHAWLNASLQKENARYLGEVARYGNTVDASINEKFGMSYADKLIFLQPPENPERRAQLWNAIKAF